MAQLAYYLHETDRPNVYRLPRGRAPNSEDELTTEDLVNVTEERGKVQIGDVIVTANLLMEHRAGETFPHLAQSELNRLLGRS